METTTPDQIATPSDGEEYAYIAALGVMAESIQKALIARGNARFGTQTARIAATASLPHGTLWTDTTGDKALWILISGQWQQVYPEPLSRALIVGSSSVKLGTPYVNLRWLNDANNAYHLTIRPGTDPEQTAASILGMKGNGSSVDVAMHLRRNGQVLVYDGTASRFLPFATDAGNFNATVTGPNNVNTINVSFTSGMFTATPVVNVTIETDRPDLYRYSVTSVTSSGFQLHVHRSASGSFAIGINWFAIQRAAVTP